MNKPDRVEELLYETLEKKRTKSLARAFAYLYDELVYDAGLDENICDLSEEGHKYLQTLPFAISRKNRIIFKFKDDSLMFFDRCTGCTIPLSEEEIDLVWFNER